MRVILDTNVFVSGVFFGGPPGNLGGMARRRDDKFLACAIASGVTVIVSGDKHLVRQSGWRSVVVLSPRQFVDEYLPASRT